MKTECQDRTIQGDVFFAQAEKLQLAKTCRSQPAAFDSNRIEKAVKEILIAIGEDPEREGLLETPSRVARMLKELTEGLHKNEKEELSCRFHEEKAGVVLVKDITFSSTCEHHMLPFTGVAHVAYLPKEGQITGLSKLARVVECVSKRLQVQERMTSQIADAIESTLDPLGVFVMVEAEHSCMVLRGIKKPGSLTVTMESRGVYKEDQDLRRELLSLVTRA
ncbi:MAG: GTP cyclohydrolase I FolE [Candidatus Obscuribacter phosphatis]|uniref:GTP cyclohydrolase 1 n=1 Tax=Candidatus Obscuribacter phosphatis TaxID=1906157 RepID=A0A8J7TL83_9BACT|nr:GTP cyclohydrolase I FolE [Candidatus Obscuribacter phosphatis]